MMSAMISHNSWEDLRGNLLGAAGHSRHSMTADVPSSRSEKSDHRNFTIIIHTNARVGRCMQLLRLSYRNSLRERELGVAVLVSAVRLMREEGQHP